MALVAMTAAAPADPAVRLWQRLAGQRLRLRDSVSVHEHRYRDRPWYLLHDELGGKQYRLSAGAYRFLAELDGRRTLGQVQQDLAARQGGGSARSAQLLGTLTQLHAAGLLAGEAVADPASLVDRQRQQRRRRGLVRWLRLLAPRFALVDPDAFLARALPWARPLLRPVGLLGWLLLVGAAAVLALMQWDALALYGAQRLEDPRSWLLLVCLYPLVKALHELGHGFAAKAGGAAVHEMGVTLLVFLPVPYVDASAASLFASKYRRMLVGAAGIMVELLLAALAMFAWLHLPDGLMRDAAFAVMLIGGISTLLFNGNPLLRFDGYYVLADALEIPNLASRAARYYGYLTHRHLLRVKGTAPPNSAPGERPWLLFYGAASTLYRLAISIGIALFLVAVVPTIGVLLAAWLLSAQILFPLGRQLHFLLVSPLLKGRRVRALLSVGGTLVALVMVLALLPVGSSTQVDGVVLLPEQAIVRAGVDGFLEQQLVAHGSPVHRGEPLFILRNRQLEADIAALEARVAELEVRRDAVALSDRLLREIQSERLAEARAGLARLYERQQRLSVRSPGDGVLQVSNAPDRQGRLVTQGELLAYVSDGSAARVRVVAEQQQAARIRESVSAVRVRLAAGVADELAGRLLDDVPAAIDVLPSAALGSRSGGAIQVDARDEKGRRTLHKVFAFDIAVPYTDAARFVGGRAFVRFEHDASPLLARAYDAARRFVMSRIGE